MSTPNHTIFNPGVGARYEKLMAKARTVNLERNDMDRVNGFASPGAGPLDLYLRNCISAITAGLSTGDWPCVAEGLDMLQQAELKVRRVETTL